MIFGQDRNELRQMYKDAWRKQQAGEVVTPLELQIATVVAEHPEYHDLIETGSTEQDFTPDGGQTNPYLHMGLHLAIREQVSTNRPAGITDMHRRLCEKHGDHHAAEHQMIECLAESLWEAQNRNAMPDEQAYLERLRRLAG